MKSKFQNRREEQLREEIQETAHALSSADLQIWQYVNWNYKVLTSVKEEVRSGKMPNTDVIWVQWERIHTTWDCCKGTQDFHEQFDSN